jgi:hypothetical protein
VFLNSRKNLAEDKTKVKLKPPLPMTVFVY